MSTKRFFVTVMAGVTGIDIATWFFAHRYFVLRTADATQAIIAANLSVAGVNVCLCLLAAITTVIYLWRTQ